MRAGPIRAALRLPPSLECRNGHRSAIPTRLRKRSNGHAFQGAGPCSMAELRTAAPPTSRQNRCLGSLRASGRRALTGRTRACADRAPSRRHDPRVEGRHRPPQRKGAARIIRMTNDSLNQPSCSRGSIYLGDCAAVSNIAYGHGRPWAASRAVNPSADLKSVASQRHFHDWTTKSPQSTHGSRAEAPGSSRSRRRGWPDSPTPGHGRYPPTEAA